MAAVAVIFTASVIIKINKGIARTVDTPSSLIRLQLENGSSDTAACVELGKYFNEYEDKVIDINVVETNDIKKRRVGNTFVVSRTKNKTSAELFAVEFGLDEKNIIYSPLENNYNQISVTLVLGEDYERIIEFNKTNKEQ